MKIKSILITILVLVLCISCFGAFSVSAEEVSEASTADGDNPLYQKSVLFAGDSIGEAACEWGSAQVGWAGRIMAWNEMTGINRALSGASISNCRNNNTVINQLKAQRANQYDYIIIEGGANDAWDSAPVGAITEGFDGPFDRSTFAGGLEETFQYAKKTFPDAQLGFIVTFQMPSATYGKLSDMSEYFSVAIDICKKWDVPYIDFYFDQDFNDSVFKSATLTNLIDYIHPNAAGYDILSPLINDWMKTLGVEPEVSEPESATEVSEEETSAPENNGGTDGSPIYVYVIIGVAVVAIIATVAVVIVKAKK